MKKLFDKFIAWDIHKFWKHSIIGLVMTLILHIPIQQMEYQWIVACINAGLISGIIEIISPMLKVGNNTLKGLLSTFYMSVVFGIICWIFSKPNIYEVLF